MTSVAGPRSLFYGPRTATSRRVGNVVMLGACVAATALGLAVLFWILAYLLGKGVHYVSLDFFTHLPVPVGDTGGGFLNAIVGTGIMVGVASAMAIPLGMLAGVYLAEFGHGWLARVVRFVNDTMSATPSIVAGLFAYGLLVVTTRHFSAFAGSVALAVLMVPTITRTTEEMVKLVPRSLREASLALGVPEWRMTVGIVLRAAAPGIITGVMLAIARVSGETAALLFTALNNRLLSTSLDGPMSSIPVQVYNDSISPYADDNHQAWAGALVLILLVATFSAGVRVVTRSRHRVVA